MRRLIHLTFRCLGLFAPLLALTLIFCNALHAFANAASLAGSDPGDWIRFYYSFNSNAVHHFETFCQKAQRLSTTSKLTSKTTLVRGLLPQCTRDARAARRGGFKFCKHATTPRLDISQAVAHRVYVYKAPEREREDSAGEPRFQRP